MLRKIKYKTATQVWLFHLLALATLAGMFFAWRDDPTVALEHHLMENTQAALLLAAVLLTLIAAITARANRLWLFSITLSLLYTSVLTRELDIDAFGDSHRWDSYETLLRGLLVVAWLLLTYRLWFHRTLLYYQARHIILTPATAFTLLGILFYAASWPFDKSVINLSINTSMFIEEGLQVIATGYFLLAAIWLLTRTAKK